MTDEEQAAEVQTKFDSIKDSQLMADHLNNHAKRYLESQQKDIIGKAKGEAYGHMDEIMFEVLGIKKESGTKTTEGIKKQLLELKNLRASKGQNTEDVEKALLAQKAIHDAEITNGQGLLKEQTDLVTSLKQSGSKRDITSAVNKELIGATFLSHYSKSDIELLGDARLSKILLTAKIEGGIIVHYNTDGTKRVNQKMLPISTKEVVAEDYAEMFEVKTPGGGAENNNSSTTVLESGKIVMNMSEIKTKTMFNSIYWSRAAELGKTRENKDDFKQYGEAMSEYGYKDLPLQ